VFAGLRSDPFYLAWIASELKKVPNLLQHDNVLCMVVEFDTRRVLDPRKGSLFGVIAETVPSGNRPAASDIQSHASTGSDAPSRRTYGSTIPRCRGRRHTRSVESADAVRDLQGVAAAVPAAPEGQLRRLGHARRQGDWTPEALAANANVFLDDFCCSTSPSRSPTKATSRSRRARSAAGLTRTGGGRTVDANSIDILLTWLVNPSIASFLQGGATGATKPGMKGFRISRRRTRKYSRRRLESNLRRRR
jgi:hypothetical protein